MHPTCKCVLLWAVGHIFCGIFPFFFLTPGSVCVCENPHNRYLSLTLRVTLGIVYIAFMYVMVIAPRLCTHTHTRARSPRLVWSRWIHTARGDLQTIITRRYESLSHLYSPRVSGERRRGAATLWKWDKRGHIIQPSMTRSLPGSISIPPPRPQTQQGGKTYK